MSRPGDRGVRRSAPARPLALYVVIAFLFSWAIEVPLALSSQGILPPMPAAGVAIAVVAATFGPTVGAFVVIGLSEGRAGVLRLMRGYVQWRVGIQWYLFVLLGVPAIILLATIIVPGALASLDASAAAGIVAYPLGFFLTLLLGGPLGEEPGWRGFALPRLQERYGPLGGSLVLGLVWAVWHLPLFWSGVWTPPTPANIVMFALMITALTIIMTWVFNHGAGSLLLMILMHTSFNAFANRIAAPLFPAPIFTEYGLLPVLLGFGVTAVALVTVTRGRLGYGALTRSRRPVVNDSESSAV